MNTTHRWLAVAVAATLSGMLAACSTGQSDAPPASKADGKYSVQFVNPLPKYPQWAGLAKCAREEAEARGVEYTETGPTGSGLDATAMISQIQQAMSSKKDAILTYPASDAFTPLLQQAQKQGIVTTTMFGSGTPDSGANVNVGFNWVELGKLFAQTIGERPGPQRVGLLAVSDTGQGKDWLDGVKEGVKAFPNVKVVAEVYTGDDAAKAVDQTNALVTAHPEVNVIATHMGTVTQGAVAALKSKKLTDKVAFIGNGPAGGGKEALLNGQAYRMLTNDLCAIGTSAIDATLARLDKKTPPADDTKPEFVTIVAAMCSKEDVESYIAKGWG